MRRLGSRIPIVFGRWAGCNLGTDRLLDIAPSHPIAAHAENLADRNSTGLAQSICQVDFTKTKSFAEPIHDFFIRNLVALGKAQPIRLRLRAVIAAAVFILRHDRWGNRHGWGRRLCRRRAGNSGRRGIGRRLGLGGSRRLGRCCSRSCGWGRSTRRFGIGRRGGRLRLFIYLKVQSPLPTSCHRLAPQWIPPPGCRPSRLPGDLFLWSQSHHDRQSSRHPGSRTWPQSPR